MAPASGIRAANASTRRATGRPRANRDHGGGAPPSTPRKRPVQDGWQPRGRWAVPVVGASLLADALQPRPASAQEEIERFVNTFLDAFGPMMTNMGFSGLMGICAAKALKSVGVILAALVGLGFICVQGLAYTGFVTVDWSRLEQTITRRLDNNQDGKVDVTDLRHHFNVFLGWLSQGVPSVGGFLAGFAIGLKW